MKKLTLLLAIAIFTLTFNACSEGDGDKKEDPTPPASTKITYYKDNDRDGLGDPAQSTQSTSKPTGPSSEGMTKGGNSFNPTLRGLPLSVSCCAETGKWTHNKPVIKRRDFMGTLLSKISFKARYFAFRESIFFIQI